MADIVRVKAFDKILNYLIMLTLVVIGGSFFYFKSHTTESTRQKEVAAQSQEVDKVVNKYLEQANQAKNLDKVRFDRAVFEANKRLMQDQESSRNQAESEILATQKIPSAAEVEEIGKKMANNPNFQTSNEGGYNSEEFDVKKMTAEEKREYKRQYIENAKNGGYNIELSDDLEVIKATPIRKPSASKSDSSSKEPRPTSAPSSASTKRPSPEAPAESEPPAEE